MNLRDGLTTWFLEGTEEDGCVEIPREGFFQIQNRRGTSEKARPLLSKTRFFSLGWPEVARIDIFEFLLHKH